MLSPSPGGHAGPRRIYDRSRLAALTLDSERLELRSWGFLQGPAKSQPNSLPPRPTRDNVPIDEIGDVKLGSTARHGEEGRRGAWGKSGLDWKWSEVD